MLPRHPSWIKGATLRGGGKEGGEERRIGERRDDGIWEGRDFGPSQCWKQIDAAVDYRSLNLFLGSQ